MAKLRKGIYNDGQSEFEVRIKKAGAKTTRIVLNDNTERVVATNSVKTEIVVLGNNAPERLIPTIPLESFYRRCRQMEGDKDAKFTSLKEVLNEGHGPKGSVFLAELFRRSIRHAEFYSNREEPFHSRHGTREARERGFANALVDKLNDGIPIQAEPYDVTYVDYEIFPFRTTMSCHENGKRATSAGSGGMDLLLASTRDGVVLPSIGEIKAATETVGPTFAIVQSLMYAAQLTTVKQFERLKKYYNGPFESINEQKPRIDVFVLIENDASLNKEDASYALLLADELCKCLSEHLRQIVFMSCKFEGNAILCEVMNR